MARSIEEQIKMVADGLEVEEDAIADTFPRLAPVSSVEEWQEKLDAELEAQGVGQPERDISTGRRV